MDGQLVNDQIRALVEAWCERKELSALARLLPAWLANNGLTDGWADLASALRGVASYQVLPAAERDQLKKLWIEVDRAVRRI